MCISSTTFPNAPAHPPILFDQSLTEILDSPKSRAQSFPEREARAGDFFMFYAAKASERAGVRKNKHQLIMPSPGSTV